MGRFANGVISAVDTKHAGVAKKNFVFSIFLERYAETYLPNWSFAGDSGGTQKITKVSKDNRAHGNIRIKL